MYVNNSPSYSSKLQRPKVKSTIKAPHTTEILDIKLEVGSKSHAQMDRQPENIMPPASSNDWADA